MKQIEINTLHEASKYFPMLSIITIGLALLKGNAVTVIDEHTENEYIFKSQEHQQNEQ